MKTKKFSAKKPKIVKAQNTYLRKNVYKFGIHNCGGGYTGQIVHSQGLEFCGFCGKEFRDI